MVVLLSWIILALAVVCLIAFGAASYHAWRHTQAAELAARRKAELKAAGELNRELMNQLRAAQAEAEKAKRRGLTPA